MTVHVLALIPKKWMSPDISCDHWRDMRGSTGSYQEYANQPSAAAAPTTLTDHAWDTIGAELSSTPPPLPLPFCGLLPTLNDTASLASSEKVSMFSWRDFHTWSMASLTRRLFGG